MPPQQQAIVVSKVVLRLRAIHSGWRMSLPWLEWAHVNLPPNLGIKSDRRRMAVVSRIINEAVLCTSWLEMCYWADSVYEESC